MSDVKRCDVTGLVAASGNPNGWCRVTITRYGEDKEPSLQSIDACSIEAAKNWLDATLPGLGVNLTTADVH